jgi:hypothetical protein
MLSRLGQHLRIGLASDGVAIARTGFWGARRAQLLAERRIAPTGQLDGIVAALRELLAASPPAGANVSIVLADELVRMWTVTPPRACARMSDLRAAAAMRFQTLFGAPPGGWRIAADWEAARPFLAVAVPEQLLAQIEQAVRGEGGRVVEVVPQFVVSLRRWRAFRRPGAWLGVVQSRVLTLALFNGADLAAVCTTAMPQGAGREWLDSQVAREALRLGVQRPERLQLFGPAPKNWASHAGQTGFGCNLLDLEEPEPLSDLARLVCAGTKTRNRQMNFASPSLRRMIHCTSAPARALALAALALAPVVAVGFSHYLDALRRYETRLASQRVRQHQVPVHKAVLRDQLLPGQAAAINSAIMQLNLPWRGLHDAVQAATPPTVALLSLEPDPKKRVLRITAEAKGSEDMIGYVERMKAQDWFANVILTRHEIDDQDQNHPVRFQLDAQWRQP